MSIIQAAEDFIREKLDKEVVEHSLRVRNYAVKLAEDENFSDRELIELAALLHDIGYIKGHQYHERNAAPFVRQFLNQHGYDLTKTGIIVNCIMKHEPKSNPETPEEKIIWDADCLDRIGALGIVRRIKKAIKYKLVPENEIMDKIKEKLDFDEKNLKTETGKKFSKEFIDFQKKFFTELDKQMSIIDGNFDFLYKIMED